MRAMYDSNLETEARNYIEKELIPQVKSFKKVTISIADSVKNGLEFLINIVVQLVKEYGLCTKMSFCQENCSYQFWYETE